MTDKEKGLRLVASILMGCLAGGVLLSHDWKTAVCIFFIFWAVNLADSVKDN